MIAEVAPLETSVERPRGIAVSVADRPVEKFSGVPAGRKAALGVLAVYAFLLFFASLHHVYWRDETAGWLIARDSHSVVSLIHNMRYEGHPPLWYLVVYWISNFTWNPEWMKVPNFMFSVVAAAVILLEDRLNLWTRIGITFSYFMLFEYAVIDRNYMMGVMFLMLAVSCMRLRRSSFLVPVLLSLASFSSLPALIVSVCMFGFYLASETLFRSGNRREDRTLPARLNTLRIGDLLGFVGFGTCVLGSIALMLPPKDSAVFLDSAAWPGVTDAVANAGSQIVKAYLPVPLHQSALWDSSWAHAYLYWLALPGWILFFVLIPFFRRTEVRWFFAAATVLLLAQMQVTGRAHMRHVGWMFIVFVLAVVLDRSRPFLSTTARRSSWRGGLVVAVLVVQVATALFFVGISFRRPFSSSKQVASFLRAKHLDKAPLIVAPEFTGQSVLAYLQRPTAFSVVREGETSFAVWDMREFTTRRLPTLQEMSAASHGGERAVLISNTRLTHDDVSRLGVSEIAAFDGALCEFDRYYLYR